MAGESGHTRRNGLGVLAGLTLVGSLVVAAWSVCMFTWTLPETDGAYGQAPFADPFVVPVMLVFVGAAWVIAFPFAWWLLRSARLVPSMAVVTGVACLAVAVFTPQFRFSGALTSFPAMLLAMAYCRRRFGAMAP